MKNLSICIYYLLWLSDGFIHIVMSFMLHVNQLSSPGSDF